MNTTQKAAATDVMLKPGYGYYDTTKFPIGGNFKRVGALAMMIRITGTFDSQYGCDTKGETADSRTVCFNSANAYPCDSEASKGGAL